MFHTMKIQPVNFNEPHEPQPKCEPAVKPVLKSRFKRLFEKPFSSVLKISAPEKPPSTTEPLTITNKDGLEEFEPSSVCLAKMVRNFIEDSNDKQQLRCGRNRCNCFNGKCTDSSDDELDPHKSSLIYACDVLKNLVPCVCVSERNLLADTAKIMERNKITKRKDGFCRKIVADGLIALGYNASICKSKWEKTPNFPAGEYDCVDVIIEGERLIIDIDFRSEFEIARSTKAYKLILQTLPNIFVGKSDRLEKITDIVSEAAKQSLKKKGMPFPPWRRAEYVKSKWLSPSTRINPIPIAKGNSISSEDEFELILVEENDDDGLSNSMIIVEDNDGLKDPTPLAKKWDWDLEPLVIKRKNINKGVKLVTGLSSIIEDNP